MIALIGTHFFIMRKCPSGKRTLFTAIKVWFKVTTVETTTTSNLMA